MKFRSILAAGLATVAQTFAQHITEHCPLPNVCYRLNIPESTARAGKGDIYLQINALISYQWVGLGMGHQMAGAKMFIIYSDGTGNVTLSPRLGRGHYEPSYDEGADVELLEGSGVDGFKLVANVLCRDCDQWIGGSMDFSQHGAVWIWAARPGLPLQSRDPDEELEQHREHGIFTWNFGAGQGGELGVNPFLGNNATNITAGHGDHTVIPWKSSDGLPSAHGTLASLVFIVLFPLGAILIRVTNGRRLVWIHAGIQVGSYFVLFLAMVMGIYIAVSGGLFSDKHPRIGVFLVLLLFFQAVDGLLHHKQWIMKQRRTWLGRVHIWTGRLVIVLGMVNGGFGLVLAKASMGMFIGYGVAAVISFVVYVAAIIYGTRKAKVKAEAARKEREQRTGGQSAFE